MSQNEMILKHLQENLGITPKQANELYGVMRLAARIKDLRNRGYRIASIDRRELNRFGKKTRFTEYRLVKESI